MFLDAHTSSGDHGKTAVVQLLSLDVCEFGSSLWLQSERIKVDVAGVVTLTERKERSKTGFDPTNVGPERLGKVDEEEEGEHDRQGNFGNLVVGDGMVDESGRAAYRPEFLPCLSLDLGAPSLDGDDEAWRRNCA